MIWGEVVWGWGGLDGKYSSKSSRGGGVNETNIRYTLGVFGCGEDLLSGQSQQTPFPSPVRIGSPKTTQSFLTKMTKTTQRAATATVCRQIGHGMEENFDGPTPYTYYSRSRFS